MPSLPNIGGSVGQAEIGTMIAAGLAIIGLEVADPSAIKEAAAPLTDLMHGDSPLQAVQDWLSQVIADGEKAIGKPLVDMIVGESMGVDLSKGDSGSDQAVDAISRAIGFAIGFPIAVTKIGGLLENLLGQRAPKALIHSLSKVGEELGLNFFLGNVLSNIFERSVGPPLEVLVNRQMHPQRFDNMTVRALLKGRVLDNAKALDLLDEIGYRPEDAQTFLQLQAQNIPVNDLATAWEFGLISDGDFSAGLARQGFSDDQVQMLTTLYLHKSASDAAALYRSIARQAFVEGDISEVQFRAILGRVNVPAASIELEVSALQLQTQIGRAHLSLAELQRGYQDGTMHLGEVQQRLAQLGYNATDSAALLAEWDAKGNAGKVGVTVQRVITYLLSKVLSPQEAYAQLTAMGLRPDDAMFLVQHPSAQGTVYAHNLDVATVISAYKDGVIDVDTATQKLADLNTDPQEAQLQLAIATAQLQKPGKPKATAKTLTVADVHEAVDLGLATTAWAVRELQQQGYTEADAQLLAALWYAKPANAPPPGWVTLT